MPHHPVNPAPQTPTSTPASPWKRTYQAPPPPLPLPTLRQSLTPQRTHLVPTFAFQNHGQQVYCDEAYIFPR